MLISVSVSTTHHQHAPLGAHLLFWARCSVSSLPLSNLQSLVLCLFRLSLGGVVNQRMTTSVDVLYVLSSRKLESLCYCICPREEEGHFLHGTLYLRNGLFSQIHLFHTISTVSANKQIPCLKRHLSDSAIMASFPMLVLSISLKTTVSTILLSNAHGIAMQIDPKRPCIIKSSPHALVVLHCIVSQIPVSRTRTRRETGQNSVFSVLFMLDIPLLHLCFARKTRQLRYKVLYCQKRASMLHCTISMELCRLVDLKASVYMDLGGLNPHTLITLVGVSYEKVQISGQHDNGLSRWLGGFWLSLFLTSGLIRRVLWGEFERYRAVNLTDRWGRCEEYAVLSDFRLDYFLTNLTGYSCVPYLTYKNSA